MRLLLITLLVSFEALAISEVNFQVIWQKEVLPYLAQGTQRTFQNAQKNSLNYYTFSSSTNKKTLVILPGRTEPAIKYVELAYDLKEKGFNLYILDHQGQGASERLLKDTQKGHVICFQDYVTDLEDWLKEVVIPESTGTDLYLLTHSMGGAIGVKFMAANPTFFKKAVLSAPMLEINTKPYSEAVGRLFAGLLVGIEKGSNYAPERGPYLPESDTFEKNELTHSRARFDVAKYFFVTYPEIAVGGPTSRWVHQSLKATKKIDRLAAKIKTPILLFQAGQDLIVKPSRQTSFCTQNEHCLLQIFPESGHEILMEKDQIRNEALALILAFFNN